MIHALGHLEAERARNGRRDPPRDVEAVQVVALLAPDLQDVAKPAGRHQGRPGSPSLQHRVGDHGRAVRQARDLVVGPEQGLKPFEHRLGGIGGRRDLQHPQRPAVGRVRHQVGERAAHVDPNAEPAAHRPAYPPMACLK